MISLAGGFVLAEETLQTPGEYEKASSIENQHEFAQTSVPSTATSSVKKSKKPVKKTKKKMSRNSASTAKSRAGKDSSKKKKKKKNGTSLRGRSSVKTRLSFHSNDSSSSVGHNRGNGSRAITREPRHKADPRVIESPSLVYKDLLQSHITAIARVS